MKQLGIDISDFSQEEVDVLEKYLSWSDFAQAAAFNIQSLKQEAYEIGQRKRA